jgi:HAD superfamily phosphoserine phosphatase-like hydrolase
VTRNANRPQPPVALLIDFDGTAALTNVGMNLIETFARDPSWKVIDNEYGAGHVGSRQAYRLLQHLLTGDVAQWRAYALTHRLDPDLGRLAAHARDAGWLVEILSDGLDVYIDALLERAGVTLPVRASRMEPGERGTHIATPYLNPLCGRCGTCKSDRIEFLAKRGYTVVFVGDGFSDLCAAPKAHRIFAKDILAGHLAEKGVAFEPFETLGDVVSALFKAE